MQVLSAVTRLADLMARSLTLFYPRTHTPAITQTRLPGKRWLENRVYSNQCRKAYNYIVGESDSPSDLEQRSARYSAGTISPATNSYRPSLSCDLNCTSSGSPSKAGLLYTVLSLLSVDHMLHQCHMPPKCILSGCQLGP